MKHDRLFSVLSETLYGTKTYLGKDGQEITRTDYLTALRRRLFEFYPDWSKEIKEYIINGQIAIGMNGPQVMAVMGFPEKQTKTVLIQLVLEYWTMRQGYTLTFKNGILAVVTDQKSGAVLFSEEDDQ